MPRAGSIATRNVAGGIAYEFLPVAYSEISTLATVGTPISSMAKYFGVSETWLVNQLKTDVFAKAAFEGAEANGELEIRQALHDTAKSGDARVLTFVAERRLGMKKEVEVKHDHVHRVIGAQPTYRLTAEEWANQYAPKELAAPQPIDVEATPVEPAENGDTADGA